MPRWEPNAADRLIEAALDLFAEQGYDTTTVVQIAQRAGLTKSTFFRHFRDKREVLFGGETMTGLLAEGITTAAADVAPLDAVAHALQLVGTEVFTPDRRRFTARRAAVIDAHPELQEREALKGLALVAAMTDALRRRDVDELTAQVTAQLGALALRLTYERWTAGAGDETFDAIARHTIDQLRAADPLR